MDHLLFEALRKKFRFPSPAGMLTTEDLWDLPLTSAKGANLDDVARALYKQLKETSDIVSFVSAANPKDSDLQNKLEIVKGVIKVRVEERDLAKASKERSEKKQRLMEIINKKQDAELENKSVDELKGLLESL